MAGSKNYIYFILLLLGMGGIWGCGPALPSAAEPPTSVCPLLDSLFSSLQQFQASTKSDVQVREKALDHMVTAFEAQRTESQDSCSYLDQNHYPEVERFDFVAPLTNWIVDDTFSQGIYYLIRLRAAFSEDPAITEFFSEELAGIALHSPHCYLQYLNAHPTQEQLLLNSTRWSTTRLDPLIQGFADAGASPAILQFLENYQAAQGNTPMP